MKNSIWFKLFIFTIASFFNSISAQLIELRWAHAQTGGDVLGNPRFETDSQGNVIVSGLLLGTLDFDPWNGSAILKSDSLNRSSGIVHGKQEVAGSTPAFSTFVLRSLGEEGIHHLPPKL